MLCCRRAAVCSKGNTVCNMEDDLQHHGNPVRKGKNNLAQGINTNTEGNVPTKRDGLCGAPTAGAPGRDAAQVTRTGEDGGVSIGGGGGGSEEGGPTFTSTASSA